MLKNIPGFRHDMCLTGGYSDQGLELSRPKQTNKKYRYTKYKLKGSDMTYSKWSMCKSNVSKIRSLCQSLHLWKTEELNSTEVAVKLLNTYLSFHSDWSNNLRSLRLNPPSQLPVVIFWKWANGNNHHARSLACCAHAVRGMLHHYCCVSALPAQWKEFVPAMETFDLWCNKIIIVRSSKCWRPGIDAWRLESSQKK